MAFAPSSIALDFALFIASQRAFSTSEVKAVTSPPNIDSIPAMNLPKTPLVRGVRPVTKPITRFILYPGTVGVVTIRKVPSEETGEPQVGQKLDPSWNVAPHFLQIIGISVIKLFGVFINCFCSLSLHHIAKVRKAESGRIL
jgi:hypothetical protein